MVGTSARLNIFRLNGGRLNQLIPGAVNTTPIVITIEGVPVTARVRVGLTIRDILNAPNLCTFTIEGAAPSVGQEVRVSLQDYSPLNVLFGGTIDTVSAFYEARPANRAWAVTCQDYTLGLNRRKVRIRYGQQGAHLIALDLLARYGPPGYTGAAIVQPLPTVTGGIDFTEEDLSECFARLAQRIGGYWYVDYERQVHLFLSEVLEAPDAIAPGGQLLLNDPPITQQTDVTQIRTRVWVEGGGSAARGGALVGQTTLPVDDATWYSASGGYVVAGPQRITYTGKGQAGGPTAPGASGTPGAGNLAVGPYHYTYAHVTGGVEALLSSASAAVTFAPVAAPPSAMAATVQRDPTYVAAPTYYAQSSNIPVAGQGGLSPGTYQWASTYVSGGKETTPAWSVPIYSNNSSWYCQWMGFPTPPAPIPPTRRIYRTSANGGRETARMVLDLPGYPPNHGDAFTDTVEDIYRQPIAPPTTNNTATGPILAPGRVDWIVTFGTAQGETLAGPVTTITLEEGTASVTLTVPTSADGRVTQRTVYRSKRNAPGTYYLEATLADNVTTTYLSTKTDAQLGSAYPGGYTAGQNGQATVTGITAGPVGTTARRLYRTTAGGSSYRLLVVLNDNATTSYTDNKSDAQLGDIAAGEGTTVLTGIPASGAGAIVLEIRDDDEVNLLVRCDDVPAQAALAALEGPPSDGIVEHFIQDRRLALETARATGNADLVLFARPIQSLRYATHDTKTAAGKSVSVNLPPLALSGTFTIQHVTIDQLGAAPNLPPRYTVEASSVRFSLEDVLRRLQLEP